MTRVPIHSNPHVTEVEAAATVAPITGRLRDQVLDVIGAAGHAGATPSEVILTIDLGRAEPVNPYSVRPRITELWQEGAIRIVGKRENARGNNEEIYQLGYDDSDFANAARSERQGYRVSSWKKEAQRLQAELDRLKADPVVDLVRSWLGTGETK